MSLALTQNATAISPGMIAFFLATGGTPPFTYTVLPGGAGGSIGASTGNYTAPTVMGSTPATLYDTIQVSDSLAATATASLLVGNALFLFCDIIQKEMGLADGRVWLWEQKIFQPIDSDLYIAISVLNPRPFGNTIKPDPTTGWANAIQTVNMLARLSIDIMSRGPSARDRKEEVILALNSIYSQYQQDANSFSIGRIPAGAQFNNLSVVDGAAIPYRFQIPVNIQYAFTKTKAVPYFDTFADVQVNTNA